MDFASNEGGNAPKASAATANRVLPNNRGISNPPSSFGTQAEFSDSPMGTLDPPGLDAAVAF